MDIQKEREAFEQHLTNTGLVEFSDYGFAVDECDEYLHEPTQVAWDSWIIGLNRAKAQATEKLKGCVMDLQKEKEAFELVVANQLQNSLYHSVFFNEATGWYDCADDAPAAVQFFCCDLNSDWRIWKAAKAQAVPEPSINMTGHDLKYIWDFMDYADPENLDTEVTIQLCKEGFDGAGLYAWVAEYPEEGGIKLGEAQEPAND